MRQARQRVDDVGEALVAVVQQVVVHERGLVGGHADHRLLELHLDEAALGAELHDVALDLHRHARDELGALEHREHVVQGHAPLELERREARRYLLEAAAVLLEGGKRLVGLGEHHRNVLEDVLRAVEVEADGAPALGDGDHERVGLLRDALRRPVPGAGLQRQDRRIRHQLGVGPEDLGAVRAEDDRAVHLGELVEQRRGVIDVELDPAREQKAQLLRLADADQGARLGLNDVVQALSDRRARGDHLQCPDQPGFLPSLKLCDVIPGVRHPPIVRERRWI